MGIVGNSSGSDMGDIITDDEWDRVVELNEAWVCWQDPFDYIDRSLGVLIEEEIALRGRVYGHFC